MARLSIYISLLIGVVLPQTGGQVAKDEKTFGWVGDVLFGNCQMSRCRSDFNRAEYCCSTGENTRCCTYTGGNWGNSGNNGGGWNNGGGGNNGGYNNNKPGTCPNYNGRKKRSPEQAPRGSSGGRTVGSSNGGRNSGRTFGNNNGGWNNGGWGNGGQGFNPGYNNNNNNNGYGRCIRDSECPGSLKCCYLYNGYQCTQPQYYG